MINEIKCEERKEKWIMRNIVCSFYKKLGKNLNYTVMQNYRGIGFN